jgi:hypothetical protein
MGVLIVDLREVESEYNDFLCAAMLTYSEHADDPRSHVAINLSFSQLLTEIALGVFTDPYGILRDVYLTGKCLLEKVLRVYRLGNPPYRVMLWEDDTVAIEF